MTRIIQGIQQFQRKVFPAHRDLFSRLAQGQRPEALFIACSDSRVSLEWITQCRPGDLFVCRNAGNVVPPHGNTDAVSATIEYAISALNVKHIVVCGHSDCGAMQGLLNPTAVSGMPDVKNWLCHADPARRALEIAHHDLPPGETLPLLTKLNIRLQLDHLSTHPQVLAGLREGGLELHGWYYQIETGEVQAWSAAEKRWVGVHESGPAVALMGAGSVQGARHA
jgi:carbonic anhydrase